MISVDRRATPSEIKAHRDDLKTLASASGVGPPRISSDGTLIVHSEDPGYRRISRFAGDASRLVGAYVLVITDDVPAAIGASETL